jgi:hypothetical protein
MPSGKKEKDTRLLPTKEKKGVEPTDTRKSNQSVRSLKFRVYLN